VRPPHQNSMHENPCILHKPSSPTGAMARSGLRSRWQCIPMYMIQIHKTYRAACPIPVHHAFEGNLCASSGTHFKFVPSSKLTENRKIKDCYLSKQQKYVTVPTGIRLQSSAALVNAQFKREGIRSEIYFLRLHLIQILLRKYV